VCAIAAAGRNSVSAQWLAARVGWLAAGGAIGSLALLLASPACAQSPGKAIDHDGPFGIAMGEPLADLGPVRSIAPGQYQVLAPTRPNDTLNYVSVFAFPNLGVCRIIGVTQMITFDTDGNKAKLVVDSIAETLRQKYGEYNKTDVCNSDIMCKDYWVDQINKHDAKYQYSWDLSKNVKPDGVNAIHLDLGASDSITTYGKITYFDVDDDACFAAIKTAQGSSL
jgi:hypothetical protein